MPPKSSFFVLLVSLLLLPLICPSVRTEPLVGGWEPIKDVKERHVTKIAKFAVAEHNKQSEDHLKLKRVVKGETQVVAGIKYRLVLAAKGGNVTNNYEAIVWEQAWRNFRSLLSFQLVKV